MNWNELNGEGGLSVIQQGSPCKDDFVEKVSGEKDL